MLRIGLLGPTPQAPAAPITAASRAATVIVTKAIIRNCLTSTSSGGQSGFWNRSETWRRPPLQR